MAPVENHLIELLPERDRLRLLARCEPVSLVLAQVLCEIGTPLLHVHFPIDSFISLVTQVDHHPALEVGMLGRDGMLGASLALGVSVVPLQAVVQGSGPAWRVGDGGLPGRAQTQRGLAPLPVALPLCPHGPAGDLGPRACAFT